MAYKDNLTLYEEMISAGVPKEQASLHAHQLGSLGDLVVSTCNEIKEQLVNLRTDMNLSNAELKADMNLIKSDMRWIKGIGYTTIALFLGNLIRLWLGH